MSFTVDLSSRVALVTGASSGMGARIAGALAESGAAVALGGRDRIRLTAVASEIESAGGECSVIAADLEEDAAAAATVEKTVQRFGRLDFLVCCAGVLAIGLLEETSLKTLDHQWRVNVRAPFVLSQAAIPYLRDGGGSIVYFISPAGQIGQAYAGAYGMSKAALAQLTRTLAVELASDGVRVNAISPGWIETPMNAELREDPMVVQLALATTPAGRLGSPDDIAPAVLFLVSDAADYITGAVLPVGGGYPSLPSSLLAAEERASESVAHAD
jgi:NAD(P)-dependent dehydrogenase (short-subunit alcohol dehydrogenase family)